MNDAVEQQIKMKNCRRVHMEEFVWFPPPPFIFQRQCSNFLFCILTETFWNVDPTQPFLACHLRFSNSKLKIVWIFKFENFSCNDAVVMTTCVVFIPKGWPMCLIWHGARRLKKDKWVLIAAYTPQTHLRSTHHMLLIILRNFQIVDFLQRKSKLERIFLLPIQFFFWT